MPDILQQKLNGLHAFAKAMTAVYPEGEFGYVWGAQGELMTDAELLRLEQWYGPRGSGTDHYYHTDRVRKWLGKKAADCSGLIMYILGLMDMYDVDMNADKIEDRCSDVSSPEPGDLQFKRSGGREVHVGVYIGDGKTVHCRGTAYGMVTTEDWEYSWDVTKRYPDIPQWKLIDADARVREDM